EDLWIHAAGYCWQHLTANYREGGEQTLALERGGSLVVHVESDRLPEQTRFVLRAPKEGAGAAGDDDDEELVRPLRRSERDEALEWPSVPGAPATFDGIPAGSYRLDLEIVGGWREKSIEFASADVVVKAGATTNVSLDVADAPKIPDPVALRGAIRI